MKIRSLSKYIRENIRLIIVFLLASLLRLVNLGYSDYQGDEIKALYLPKGGQSFYEFIMEQKKGPLQFFITYVIKFFDSSYENQFLVRLSFAVAGILAVVFFYKLVKIHFGEKIAFYSSLFFATNGLFIAFKNCSVPVVCTFVCYSVLILSLVS